MKVRCKYDDLVPLHKIIPNPKNPNEHNPESIDFLAKNIDYQGVRWPIIVSNRSGFIAAGHGRLYAAMKNKYETFPVVYQDFESEAQEYEFLVADNKLAEFSETDHELVLEAIKDIPNINLEMLAMPDLEDVKPDSEVESDPRDDEVPDVDENPYGIERGDIWELGEHRVMCGDSTSKEDVDRLMGGEKVDMVFTDPPYGLNWSGGTWAQNIKYKKAKKWDVLITTEQLIEIVSYGEKAIVWGGNYYSMPPSKCWLAWKKPSIPTMADIELAWTNIDKPAKQFEISRCPDGEKIHAAQKPIALIVWALEVWENPYTVLDPFLGSGSTLIACEKTNRKCYGMEIDPHYCSVILKRWEDFTGNKARRIMTN
jgi:DNA modification methylase